jgi:hypothetical protein
MHVLKEQRICIVLVVGRERTIKVSEQGPHRNSTSGFMFGRELRRGAASVIS